jgi:hypothetical protein
MTRRITLVLVLALIGLAACGDNNPAPSGDPPILTNLDALPKEIATIELTATPTPVLAGGQPVNVSQPTPTLGPPPPTATLTPYVGIFLGEPTAENGQTVPNTIPTLAPYILNPGTGEVAVSSSGGNACSIPVTTVFANAYNADTAMQQRLGCPLNGGFTVQMVTQPFERGSMYWRDTRQIYALANDGQFWQVADSWQDGMPADDPAFSPPGGLYQPVRGFGLAWRTDQTIRDALGWGTQPEAAYNSTWQDFENGVMFVGGNNLIYAIYMAEGQHSGPLSP